MAGLTLPTTPMLDSLNPAFWERDELCAIAGGFGHEGAGLLNGSVQAEPFGLCLRDGYAG